MTALTKIQWATHTFNPWIGCQHVSPGCVNCYAEVNTFTRAQRGQGRELWGGPHTARHVVSDTKWREVLKWNEEAKRTGERTRVFCASMADWLEDRPDLVEPRARLIDLIERTDALTWLMLTKRPENAARLILRSTWFQGGWPLNVWFGFSAEDQRRLNERWPHVRKVPADIRFCSYEPALGPIDFTDLPDGLNPFATIAVDPGCHGEGVERDVRPELHWVIYGGESGPNSRPNDIAWARTTRDQCAAAGVAFFMKQYGERVLVTDSADADFPAMRLKDRKGGDMAEWPEDIRVREFPA